MDPHPNPPTPSSSQGHSGGRADNPAHQHEEVHSIHALLDQVESVSENSEKISLGMVLDAVGEHSFAPLLLITGLIMLAPGPADIPGVPVILGLFVIGIAIQPLMRHEHIWVPRWMEKREISSRRAKKMVGWLRRPAGWIDHVIKQRYTWLVDHAGVSVIAVACILIAASTPVLEFVPFSANLAGAAITAFGLALLARDGLLAGLAILFSIGTAALVLYQFAG